MAVKRESRPVKISAIRKLLKSWLVRNFGIFAFAIVLLCLVSNGECLPNDVMKSRIQIISENKRDAGRNSNATMEKAMKTREVEFFHNHRNRRYSDMIPIRDRIPNAICSYEVITDVNYQRIPSKIDRVICKADDCKVISDSDYKCAQLYAQLNVTYPKSNCRMEFEVMNIEYACICAKSIGSSRITIIEPVFT